jgi:hypothetical protein
MTADMDIDYTRRNKKPRPLSEHEKEKLDEFVDAIHYSARCVAAIAVDASEADGCIDTPMTRTSTVTCSFPSRCSRSSPRTTSTPRGTH